MSLTRMHDALSSTEMSHSALYRAFDSLLLLGVLEDIHTGDITSNALFKAQEQGTMTLIAKEALTLSGLLFVEYMTSCRMQGVRLSASCKDGQDIPAGTQIAELTGPLRQLLAYERMTLNVLQTLSGITTQTRRWVHALRGSSVRLLDTRKTLMGHRLLQKYATQVGGACNHRYGLYDMYMIKDTHLCGQHSLNELIDAAYHHRQQSKEKTACFIEVECHSLDTLERLPYDKVDLIMLDNMNDPHLSEAITIIDKRARIEVSGNLRLQDLPFLKTKDIDYISAGSITHSARAVDITMKPKRKPSR